MTLYFEGKGGGGRFVLPFEQKDDAKIAASAGGYIRMCEAMEISRIMYCFYTTLSLFSLMWHFKGVFHFATSVIILNHFAH